MLIISLTYVAPVERIDALLDEHIAWLKRGHEAGHFIAWGRKVPRTGGVIFAHGDRAAVEALANTDPYVANRVAEVEVIEFVPTFAAEGLERLTQ